jgi:hypothetical protein
LAAAAVRTMPVDPEFGAQHTELKLSIVESYLKAFTTALKPHFAELWYIVPKRKRRAW